MSYRTGSTPSNLRLSAPLLIDDDCQNAQSVSPKALRCAITVNHCSDGKSSLGVHAATHHERRIVRLLARALSSVFLKFFTVAQRFTQLFQPHGGGENSSEDATMSPNSARSPAHLASQQHAHEKRRNCKTTPSAAHRSHNHQRRRHVTPSTSSESYGRAQRKKKGGFRLRRCSARGLERSDLFTSCGGSLDGIRRPLLPADASSCRVSTRGPRITAKLCQNDAPHKGTYMTQTLSTTLCDCETRFAPAGQLGKDRHHSRSFAAMRSLHVEAFL